MRLLVAFVASAMIGPLGAQEDEAPELASKPPVEIIFTPPALDGRIVLGIFDEAGKLRRTMEFEPGSPELKIDTNGYIATWDGLDDAGTLCAAGRYSARGYMVDKSVSVEGVSFHFNDWFAQDGVGASHISLQQAVPSHEFVIEVSPQRQPWAEAAKGQLVALPQPDGSLQWDRRSATTREQARRGFEAGKYPPGTSWFEGNLSSRWKPLGPVWSVKTPPHLEGRVQSSVDGKDGTLWAIVEIGGQKVVRQFAADGEVLRELRVPDGEPQPSEIRASRTEDLILLAENSPGFSVQRVRMLRRAGDAAPAQDGRAVADWEVVFERTLEYCSNFNVVDGKLVADGGPARQADGSYPPPANELIVPLADNVLEPRKTELRLKAAAVHGGSALISADGLSLIPVSSDGGWHRFALVPGGKPGEATLYQGNYCVVEEFALRNLDHIGAFDAGTFLLAPAAP